MSKKAWIIAAATLVAIGVGSIYAMKSNPAGPIATGETKGIANPFSSNLVVPQGTALTMRLQSTISTKTAQVGDRFQAEVTAPVHVNDHLAIPAGSKVIGHVIHAKQPGKASGRGELQLAYDQVAFEGRSYHLGTRSQVYESKSGTKKDVAMIGGGAVAGGVLGGVLGGKGDIAKGAVIGGAAGTGASLLTRGPQLTLAQGTILRTHLDQSLSVHKPRQSA